MFFPQSGHLNSLVLPHVLQRITSFKSDNSSVLPELVLDHLQEGHFKVNATKVDSRPFTRRTF
jgi:hypothetical protein